MDGRSGLFLTLLLGATFLLAYTPWLSFLRSLKPMALFMALIFFFHLFSEGTPLLNLPFFLPPITLEGLYRGIFITWQFLLLISFSSLLTMTTSPSELILGIERLLRPLKPLRIPSHDLALMISLAFRFMPTLLEEMETTKMAQEARGADFQRGNPGKRIRTITALAFAAFTHFFLKAQELAAAMEARGYRPGPRTYLRELRLTGADYAAGVILIGVFSVSYLLEKGF